MPLHTFRLARFSMSARLDFTAPAGVVISVVLNLLVFALLGTVILVAAWQENRDASQRAYERVEFELAELREGYGRIATDYAWWDEALDHIAIRRDVVWTDGNVVQWLDRTVRLTSAYAFDGDGRLIYSSTPGRGLTGDISGLIAAARAMPSTSAEAVTGFATVDGRPLLVAAAVLRPMVPMPGEHYGNVLVLGWDMETVVQDRMRTTTRMIDLSFSEQGRDSLELRDIDGQPLLRLNWRPEQPGCRFVKLVLPSAGLTLAVLSAIGWWYWLRGRQHLRALVAAEDSRLRLLAAISHDLRQPLQSMALFSAALENEVCSAQGMRAVSFLRKGIERMDELLGAILKLARLDMQPDGALPLGPVALDGVMRGLVEELQPQAAAKGLSLRYVPTSLMVESDPVMLAALLRNLISNAIRYTPDGKVLLGVRRRRGGTEIWVCDTGIGIADHQQRLIFEEFFQVGNPSRDPVHGVGLGLSIVQRLARLLECRVSLWSEPGRGSRFAVSLAPAPRP